LGPQENLGTNGYTGIISLKILIYIYTYIYILKRTGKTMHCLGKQKAKIHSYTAASLINQRQIAMPIKVKSNRCLLEAPPQTSYACLISTSKHAPV
jgi:hypothetical protein